MKASDCKEVVIIQMKDRPGFNKLISMLESLGMLYSIEEIDISLFQLASSFQIVSDPAGTMTTVYFPAPSLRQPIDHANRKSKDGSIEKKENRILTSNPDLFVILKVFKHG